MYIAEHSPGQPYEVTDSTLIKEIVRQRVVERQRASYETSKFIVFDIGKGFSGFGGMVARRKLALQFGEYLNRTVILNFFPLVYADPYKRLGIYSMEDIKNENIVECTYDYKQLDKVVHFNFDNYWKNLDLKRKFHERSVPGLDFKMFSGILLNLLELKEEYKDLLLDKMREIAFDDSVPKIGLHVRRGDKEADSPFIPLDRYLEEVRRVSSQTGIKTIYLCSDDGDVYGEVLDDLTGYTIIYDKYETRKNSKISNPRLVFENKINREEETFTAVKNIELLSRCSHVIGQSNVQFAKVSGCRCIDATNDLHALTLINPFSLSKTEWDYHNS